jgi:hypothetical protein
MADTLDRAENYSVSTANSWRRLRSPSAVASGKSRVSPRRAVLEHLEIKTLVLVAGASGAGKSTFLDILASNSLPPSIMKMLPDDCSGWLQTNGTKVIGPRAREMSRSGVRRLDGAVLHYDILCPFDTGVKSYKTDASLALVNRASRIVIVDIRPRREVLRAHLAERLTFRRVPPFIARMMSRSVALRVGAFLKHLPDFHRLTGNRLAPLRVRDRQRWNDRYVALRSLYEREDWLNGWYREWDNYIKSAAGDRLIHVLDITPEDGAPSPSFRLAGVYKPGQSPLNRNALAA